MKKKNSPKAYTFKVYSVEKEGGSWEKIYSLTDAQGNILREVRADIPNKFFTYTTEISFPHDIEAVKWFNQNYLGF